MTTPKRTWSVIRKRPRAAAALGASAILLLVAALAAILVLTRSGPAPAPPVASEDDHAPEPVEPAPRPDTLITFEQGCLTDACHASFATASSTHAPVTQDACEVCHAPDAGNHTFPVAHAPGALCTSCHDIGAARPFHHGATTAAGCLACHDPHASPGPFLLAASTLGQTCLQCHPGAEGRTRHTPYAKGECLACHEPHAADNPNLLLAGAGRDHCGLCHQVTLEIMESAPYAHRDLENECLSCHAPHASNDPALLNDNAASLCLSCHQDIRRLVDEAVVTHDAVLTGRRCLSCHTPHAADNPMMLVADQTEVCLECHSEPVTTHDGRIVADVSTEIRQSPFVHGPVDSSQCGACHAIHGAQYARLLREINPEVLFGRFDIQNYALCFSCHTQNLVLEERTTVSTDFRDGDVNLHYVHVKKGDRARSCGSCHQVHGSELPRLMADSVAYQGGDWIMPVRFEATVNGGSCAPGCHEPLSYSRILPAAAPGADQNGGRP